MTNAKIRSADHNAIRTRKLGPGGQLRPARPPKPKAPTTRPATIGLTTLQRERLYAAARRQGYTIQFGARSELGAFMDWLIGLAEAAPAPAPGGGVDPETRISLTPQGEALFEAGPIPLIT